MKEVKEEKIKSYGIRDYFKHTVDLFTIVGILLIFFIQIDIEKVGNEAAISFFWFFSGLLIIILLILIFHVSAFGWYRKRIYIVSMLLFMLTFVFTLQFSLDLFYTNKGVYILAAFKGLFAKEIRFLSMVLLAIMLAVYLVALILNRNPKKNEESK